MRVLLVTNFVPHYRTPFYERLARAVDVEFIFFSLGTEPYWQKHLGSAAPDIPSATMVGHHLGAGLNVNPRLTRELWTRDYDVLIKCLNGRIELATAFAIAKARRKPFVFWNTIWWHPVTFLGWLSQPPLKAVYHGADAIVTDGGQISRFVAGYGVDPGKLFTAECSIDNDRFMAPVSPAERQALRVSLGATERPLILAVSRLVPEKGLDGLVRAAERLSDLKPVVAVVGTGPLGEALTTQAAAARVDLRLLGGLAPERMPLVYAAADVYTMPSVTTPWVREPWGLGVNEAHCRSVPVVVSDAVGAAAGRLVVHDETGLVVPERDDAQLAAALRSLLVDRRLAKKLAKAGHERVKATNYDAMVDAFRSAIDFAVATHSSRPGSSARRP
jgi:glycosyltransferase involved in cell wall biosynthesis